MNGCKTGLWELVYKETTRKHMRVTEHAYIVTKLQHKDNAEMNQPPQCKRAVFFIKPNVFIKNNQGIIMALRVVICCKQRVTP